MSAEWDASARGTWKLGCGESALLDRGRAGEEGWAGVEVLGRPERGKGREEGWADSWVGLVCWVGLGLGWIGFLFWFPFSFF